MYRSIARYLCCPLCRGNLSLHAECVAEDDVLEGSLRCDGGHMFHISQGVADFNSAEQDFANQWESLSENQNFADLDSDMDARNSDQITQRREMVLSAITAAVSARPGKLVMDIASGRGLLLTELVKELPDDVHIISIDLSAFILKYDRRKFRELSPEKKISFLACDATNLPLKDSVVDAATTYCGFSNMLGCAGDALREAHRVIKPGGVLADSFVVIERESKGYEILQQVCAGQQISGAEAFFLHDGLAMRHSNLFSDVRCRTVFEGVGIDNGMDLLPYPDEWYAEQVFISAK